MSTDSENEGVGSGASDTNVSGTDSGPADAGTGETMGSIKEH